MIRAQVLEPNLIQQDYFKDLYVDVDLSSAYARALSRDARHAPSRAAMSVDRFLNQFLLVSILVC
jgi:hypothetical protein